MPAVFRFGRNALLEIAVPATGGAAPALTGTWTQLCVGNQINVKTEKGKETINNFCTNGQDVDVPDGSTKGTLDLGDMTWAETDAALTLMETAAFSPTEAGGYIWANYWPLGKGTGKKYYQMQFQVMTWEHNTPSKGLIKAKHEVAVTQGPTPGTSA